MTTYRIVRFYRDLETPNETIETGLTLKEAQAHCKDPTTSTEEYFDGYDEEEGPAYDGNTNRSTWLVGLWINNDYDEYHRMLRERPFTAWSARVFAMTSPLKNSIKQDGAIFDNVNWEEIAEDWNKD